MFELSGKTLSGRASTEYIDALLDVMGLCSLHASINAGLSEKIPDETLRRTYINILYHDNYDKPPLDYALLEAVHLGLKLMYGEKGARGFSRRAGQAWWGQESPLYYKFSQDNNLHGRLSPVLLAKAKMLFQEGAFDTRKRIYSFMSVFAEVFGEEIETRILLEQTETGFDLIFAKCPFCWSKHPETCRVFWGVMNAFMHWLYGGGLTGNTAYFKEHFRLDEQLSTHLSLVVNYSGM